MTEKMSPAPVTPTGSDFKVTLNLPQTDFPLRADSKINDPLTIERWERESLYAAAMKCNAGAQKYILHDGPPYANGHIHLGHAYDKILKDIVTKSHRMMGFHVPMVPGWDCHGLPIEHKVSGEHPELAGAALQDACRAYAARWVSTQRDEFKRLGVVMDWEHPYITMDPTYEASVLRALAKLVSAGYIERKNKSIPWCFTCKTALAAAEIEYQDRRDPSIYVLFELSDAAKKTLNIDTQEAFVVVWTTTPWTIPLNRAVLIRPGASYAFVEHNGTLLLLGEALVPALAKQLGVELPIRSRVSAEQLVGLLVHHPLTQDHLVPLLADQSVGLDEGTACVHCAPGCGPIDYEVGVKHNLEIYSPLTADGKYADGIEPTSLVGKSILDGQKLVVEALKAAGKLLFETHLTHSYPHCWRCHQGLMFRATPQWFCSLSHEQLRDRAVAAIEQMTFFPRQGKSFLRATVESRWEWCLSRQRSWGVPIPALVARDGSHALLNEAVVNGIADQVECEGISYWQRVTVQDMIAQKWLPSDFPVDQYRKEMDVLDVWFDAGVSHFAVLAQRPELHDPADLYLEGIDQHRGWFQSSLLTSMMLNGRASTRAIMTHGFTVDDKGRKMSKSLGNVVAPTDIIEQIGTDGLRLWVASVGNEGDAVVSKELIAHVGQVYRKLRNTARFLLQNLFDYDHARDAVSFEQLSPLDQHALFQLMELQERLIAEYGACNPTALFHLLNDFCTVQISALYGDMVKDVLYCSGKTSVERRAVQTTFWYMLDSITKLMAPVASFLAEQVADHYQGKGHPSIHLQQFADHQPLKVFFARYDASAYRSQWDRLMTLRDVVLKLIEEQRAAGTVKHSLDAAVDLSLALDTLPVVGSDPESFFRLFFIVSQVNFLPAEPGSVGAGITDACLQVRKAGGRKCPRCWQWFEEKTDGLCTRCTKAVTP